MNVLLLCSENDLTRERRGLAAALAETTDVLFLTPDLERASDLPSALRERGVAPDLAIAPDAHGRCLPPGVERLACPTAILHIDSFSGVPRRAELSRLFDLTVVFHPASVAAFRGFGIEAVTLVPHAIDAGRAPIRDARDDREIDVAFVGRVSQAHYGERTSILRMLRESDHRVALEEGLSYEEMLDLYGRARIGVNLPRDDYPRDANLRCFEVMGSGALLLTRSPSELEEMGFVEGEHFAGYTDRADLAATVDHFLARPDERQAIAARGQARVLEEHTYRATARRLLSAVDDGVRAHAAARLAAPVPASADIYARHCLAHGAATSAVRTLAAAPLREWATAERARTVARLARSVCGRLVTGQPVR